MKKDMFFCIGAQKAGTTTLHDIFKQNPAICLTKEKETNFFSSPEINKRGLGYYFQECFDQKKCGRSQVMGEVDPNYCFLPGTLERIANQLSMDYRLKFIFIMRNPVNRAYSHYLMSLRRGYEVLSFEEAIAKEPERLHDLFGYVHLSYIKRGHYLEQIEALQKLFSKDQVLFVLFEEDLLSDIKGTITKIHDFLEIPPFDYDYQIRSNPASEPRSTVIRNFIYKASRGKNLLKKWIPSQKLRRKLKKKVDQLNSKEVVKEEISSQLYRKIWSEHYEDDLPKLEMRIKRSLISWKELP